MAKSKDHALVPPRMTILSDHPILRVGEEEKRREPDSFTLHSRLGAVYGDWGADKSSAMRWLSDQLGKRSKRSEKQRGGRCVCRYHGDILDLHAGHDHHSGVFMSRTQRNTGIGRPIDRLFDALWFAALDLTAGGFFLFRMVQLAEPQPAPTESLLCWVCGPLLIVARQICDLRRALRARG